MAAVDDTLPTFIRLFARPPGVQTLTNSDNLYRIRVGDYRVIYQVEKRLVLVTVIRIGHRRDVYR